MGFSISDSILGWLSCVQQKETRVSLELQDRKTSLEAGANHWKGTISRQRLDDRLHVLYPVPCAHSLSFVLGVHFLFFSLPQKPEFLWLSLFTLQLSPV